MTRSLVLHLMQYNQLTYDHPAITTLLLEDLVLEKQFDIALSLSRYVRRDNIDWSSTASPLDVHICTQLTSHTPALTMMVSVAMVTAFTQKGICLP